MFFFLNRMLFEWLRDRWKEQAHDEIVSLEVYTIMNFTYCYFKYSFLFFLYEPLPRVLSASGVIMRFKKKIIHVAAVWKIPRPLDSNTKHYILNILYVLNNRRTSSASDQMASVSL
jgi:hypothetical protein